MSVSERSSCRGFFAILSSKYELRPRTVVPTTRVFCLSDSASCARSKKHPIHKRRRPFCRQKWLTFGGRDEHLENDSYKWRSGVGRRGTQNRSWACNPITPGATRSSNTCADGGLGAAYRTRSGLIAVPIAAPAGGKKPETDAMGGLGIAPRLVELLWRWRLP
jgi:hypothetical protein